MTTPAIFTRMNTIILQITDIKGDEIEYPTHESFTLITKLANGIITYIDQGMTASCILHDDSGMFYITDEDRALIQSELNVIIVEMELRLTNFIRLTIEHKAN